MQQIITFWLAMGCVVGLTVTATAVELPFGVRGTLDDEYLFPGSVTTGDLDGDGLDDVVAAALNDSSIAWWRSLGDGTFFRYDIAVSIADINDVEVADIDGDGDLDVVVTSGNTTDAVGWFENDGTPMVGAWPLRLIAVPFDGASGTAIGDLDGDGDLDVVGVAASAHVVTVAINTTGTGIGWSYETVDATFAGARWTSVGDIDQDGDLDIAAAAMISGEVSWWSRDPGGGTWSEHRITTVSAADVLELVDMDHDGDLDALGAGATSAIRWWENNGFGGGWTWHTVGDPTGNVSAAYPADLDLDGDPDVIYAAYGSDGVGWYENTAGDGLIWEIHVVDAAFDSALDIAVGDFDRDGDPDLVAVASADNEVAAWENLSIHRSASFPHQTVVDSDLDGANTVAVVDVDRDGDLDVVGAGEGGEVTWWENTAGDGSTFTAHAIDSDFVNALDVITADVDGDGDADVVGSGGLGTPVSLWRNNDGTGGAWSEETVFSYRALELAGADLDSDGDIDLVAAMSKPYVIENSAGDGSFWIPWPITSTFNWTVTVDPADVDGDGDLDVVAGNSGNGISWFENDGALPSSLDPWLEHPVVVASISPGSVRAADLDGDGDLDIVASDWTTDGVLWISNNLGDGSDWTLTVIDDGSLSTVGPVAAADLDCDGDLDVVVGIPSTGDLVWLENTSGDASTWSQHWFSLDVSSGYAIEVADIDGNGMPDVLSTNRMADDIYYFANRGGQAALPTEATAPSTLDPMTLGDVLEITAVHRGRTGDGDAEVESIDVLLTDGGGAELTDAEADALLFGIYVFEDDDDSGDFDPVFDSEAGSVNTFSMTGGVQTIEIMDGLDIVQFAHDLSRTLFVVIVFETDAASQTPGELEVVHLAASSSVEDRSFDLPLQLEWTPDVSSGVVAPTDPSPIFTDGFESGDMTAWSGSEP